MSRLLHCYALLILSICMFIFTESRLLHVHAQTTVLTPFEQNLDRIKRATVLVYLAQETRDDLQIICVGSGTLVSRRGLILTNAHHTVPNDACNGNTIIIALSLSTEQAPIPLYRAEVAQANEGLDLAVLQITQSNDGRTVDLDTLSLPFVELGDSNLVELDDTVSVMGYINLSADSVQLRRGTITSFTAEPSGGEKTWFKTSAAIPALMAGGGVYNQDGELIGIPTTAPLSRQTSSQTCLVLQDTNQDGTINERDTCIPIGGFINALRPSSFAQPLVRAATLQTTVEVVSRSTAVSLSQFGFLSPFATRFFFSTAINEANMPTNVITSAPTGTRSLYLFFDYANMQPNTVYELRVNTDNIPNTALSLAPVRWSGTNNGLWYIGTSNQVLPNGVYDFTLLADNIVLGSTTIVIGGGAQFVPSFSDIVFGLADESGNPLGNGFVLPVGTIANARFIYRNMQDGLEWTARWFYEGVEIFRSPPDVWRDGADGSKTISIQDANGLLPGKYRLELYIAGRLSATSDFTLAGLADGAFPKVFSEPTFIGGENQIEALNSSPTTNYPNTVENLFAQFDWNKIGTNTRWRLEWYIDEELFFSQNLSWVNADNGTQFLTRLARSGGLLDGRYRIDLYIDEIRLATNQASVGIGQLPIDRFADPEGLALRGRILDASSQQGLEGVSFILISDQFSVADFVWNTSQIYDVAVTDRNGYFELVRPLELSNDDVSFPYSVLIRSDGYLPIEFDGFVVKADTPNPLELTIYLTKGNE